MNISDNESKQFKTSQNILKPGWIGKIIRLSRLIFGEDRYPALLAHLASADPPILNAEKSQWFRWSG